MQNRFAGVLRCLCTWAVVTICTTAPVLAREAAAGFSLERPDGSTISWYLDAPSRSTFPIVAILQGSECLRVSDKYRPWIERLRAAGVGVLRVEKPGLRADTPVGQCPPEYLRLNTLDRRVLDLLAVVASLRGDHGWDGRLVLVGGSEGGMVAAAAAPLIPETRAVVLISSGGGQSFQDDLLESMASNLRQAGATDEQVAARLDLMRETMGQIIAHPTPDREWMSDDRLARNTWLWWAGALPFTPLHPLLRLSCPILIVHGDHDSATPVRSARKLEEAFRRTGKTNLTLRRYAGGHDPSAEVTRDVLDWLVRVLPARGAGEELPPLPPI